MNDQTFRIYGAILGTITVVSISWYFWKANKREQEQFEIGKRNSEYFMDRIKIQEMEKGLG